MSVTNHPGVGIEAAFFSVTQTCPEHLLPLMPSTSLEDTSPEQNGGSRSSHQSGFLVTGRSDEEKTPVQRKLEESENLRLNVWCFPVKTSASVLRQLLVERVFSVSVFYVWTKTNFQFRLHFLETPLILLIPITYPSLADVCERSVQTPSPGMNVRLFLFERTHHGGNEKWYILYMIPENKIEVLKQLHIFEFKQWLALLHSFTFTYFEINKTHLIIV